MKRQALLFFSLCAALGFTAAGCGDSNGPKSCSLSSDCNDPGKSDYFCDQATSTCVRYLPAHCSDGQTNDGETDVDCGGTCVTDAGNAGSAKVCGNGSVCAGNDDCSSKNCVNNRCAALSCDPKNDTCPKDNNGKCDAASGLCISCADAAKNGTETDVDCGGSCPQKCAAGKACASGTDCEKGVCENSICSDVELKQDPSALLINEFMAAENATASSQVFFPYNGDNIKQCKFVEIVNTTTQPVSLEGCILKVKRTDTEKTSETPLTGVITAKGVLVVHNCDNLPLPSAVSSMKLEQPKNIAQTGVYEVFIACGEAESKHVTAEKAEKGYSMNQPEDLVYDEALISHKDATGNDSGAPASPGYCANGGDLLNSCSNTCNNGEKDDGESDVDCGGNCKACAAGKACNDGKDCQSKACEDNVCMEVNNACLNGEKDGDESDVDCGGSCPKKCAAGKACGQNSDCGSNICEDKVCADSCHNDKKDGDETDVDCGGSCNPCGINQKCEENSDCTTKKCKGNVCVEGGGEGKEADPSDLIITEFMAAEDKTKSSTSFFTINGPNVQECKFIEVVNMGDETMSLDGCSIIIERTDSEKTPNTTPLSGDLEPRGVIVAHACEENMLPLPENTLEFKLSTTSIAQTGTYEVYVQCNEEDGVHIDVPKATKGTSMNLASDFEDKNETMIPHTEVPGSIAVASPGYCTNGGLYKEDCQTHCSNTKQDEDETDVDCGGKGCPKCKDGKACDGDDDCQSGKCEDDICVENPDKPECSKDAECGEGKKCNTKEGKCYTPSDDEPTCEDKTQNGNETDKDCGGDACDPCEEGQKCKKNSDCSTQKCEEDICVASSTDTCSNKTKDGDETDKDCGGSCPKCKEGQECKKNSDCETGKCGDSKKCEKADVVVDTAATKDLLINEFMAAEDKTQSSKSFFTINGENVKECKFIEAVNIGKNKLTLDGCFLVVKRTDAEKPLTETKLEGTLPVNGVVVAHACEANALPLPTGTLEFTLSPNNIAQGGAYEVYVRCGETEGTHFISPAVDTKGGDKGKSMNLSKDLDSSNKTFILHTEVAGSIAVASPGYCANGGKFSEGCKAGDTPQPPEQPKACNTKSNPCPGTHICTGLDDDNNGYCMKKCTKDTDCSGGYCFMTYDNNNFCTSCSDGIQTGTEIDVDCGDNGDDINKTTKCDRCTSGKKCYSNADCKSGICSDGTPVGTCK